MEKEFSAGFARVKATPPMNIPIWGYYIKRFNEGVLDDLEINAVALKKGDTTVLLMTVDHCGLFKPIVDKMKDGINKVTGIDKNAVFIHSTHTHTAPEASLESDNPLVLEYTDLLIKKTAEAAELSIKDLKSATIGFAVGNAPNVAFIRRFRMKDGSVKTNPGVGNPDILAPIGEIDERVGVLRIDRKNSNGIIIANFGNHPDVVGGSKISRDWPGFTRDYTEKAIDNVNCIFFNGAQGDVNHVNVNPKGGDMNGMFLDFDGCARGYEHAKHIGRVIAGAIMQVYSKTEYFEVDEIKYIQRLVDIPSNKPTPEELPLAHEYTNLHNQGKDDQIPFKAMMLTTVVADAMRKVRLENAPEFFPLLFSAIRIGCVAFLGIPGEPFTPVGRQIKETDGYKLIFPCCNTNAKEGYFPMLDAYQEGGYEAKSSNFKAGSAEILVQESKKILKDLL
jgi:hypothetical protein